MRLARAIATIFIFGVLVISNFKQPVRAVGSCQDNCANEYSACNNQVYNDYQSCMSDCDALYPWWSGCPSQCLSNRDSGWSQCDSNYNSCLANCPP
jgi:hypothetical protein